MTNLKTIYKRSITRAAIIRRTRPSWRRSFFLVEEIKQALELLFLLLWRCVGAVSSQLLLRLPQVLSGGHRRSRRAASDLVVLDLAICVESLLGAIGFLLAMFALLGGAHAASVLLFRLGQVDVVALHAVLRALRRVRLPSLTTEGARLRVRAHSTLLTEADAYFRDWHDAVVDVHFPSRPSVMLWPYLLVQRLRARHASGIRRLQCHWRLWRQSHVAHGHLLVLLGCAVVVAAILVPHAFRIVPHFVWPVVEGHSLHRQRRLTRSLEAASLGEAAEAMHILPMHVLHRVEGGLVDLRDRWAALYLVDARFLDSNRFLDSVVAFRWFACGGLVDHDRRSLVHVLSVLG